MSCYFFSSDHPEDVKQKVLSLLKNQGFHIENQKIQQPNDVDKIYCRKVNEVAVKHKRESMSKYLKSKEDYFIKNYIANGNEINPSQITPCIYRVERGHEYELLFRYVYCHWSIPVSGGYGRRLRYVIIDEHNGKLIGILGLCDPVYALKARDEWIGWNNELKKDKISCMMDAFVLGAAPPYNMLLGGKLIASICFSKTIYNDFNFKYGNRVSRIASKNTNAKLSLITTSSALGRSSIYNRIKLENSIRWKSLGFTKGSGEFHFSNGMYKDIFNYVSSKHNPSLKNSKWGNGWRNKREVIKLFLSDIGLPQSLLYHGINREIFAAELGTNTLDFLTSKSCTFLPHEIDISKISDLVKERWILPRAQRTNEYKKFINLDYKIW